jgi:hypothetical protein
VIHIFQDVSQRRNAVHQYLDEAFGPVAERYHRTLIGTDCTWLLPEIASLQTHGRDIPHVQRSGVVQLAEGIFELLQATTTSVESHELAHLVHDICNALGHKEGPQVQVLD